MQNKFIAIKEQKNNILSQKVLSDIHQIISTHQTLQSSVQEFIAQQLISNSSLSDDTIQRMAMSYVQPEQKITVSYIARTLGISRAQATKHLNYISALEREFEPNSPYKGIVKITIKGRSYYTVYGTLMTDQKASYAFSKEQWENVLKLGEQGMTIADKEVQVILDTIKDIAVRTKIIGRFAEIKSGTSGSRAVIANDYSVNNYRRVIQAYLDIALSDEKLLNYNGQMLSYAEVFFGKGVKAKDLLMKGVPIFGDTRFMNEEFKRVCAIECMRRGIKVIFVKDDGLLAVPTPIGSLWAKLNDFAFTFNNTPSHNKADNDGVKFNPKDGGPASDFIVNVVNERIKEYLKDSSFETDAFAVGCQKYGVKHIYTTFNALAKKAKQKGLFEEVSPAELMSWYNDQARPRINIEAIAEKVRNKEMTIVHTPFYGSANGYTRDFYKDHADLLDNGIYVVNEERRELFDGKAPRPNAANLKVIGEFLQKSGTRLTIGYLTDPDSDRVMFVVIQNGQMRVIPMNEFLVAEAFYLYYVKGYRGKDLQEKSIIAKTLATSNKVLAVSRLINKLTAEHRVPAFIEPMMDPKEVERITSGRIRKNDFINTDPKKSDYNVGFKYFHDDVESEQAIVAGEESDGQTIQGWTIDKDGLIGARIAEEMTAVLDMDLGTFLDSIDAVLKENGIPHEFVSGGHEIRVSSNDERDEKMKVYQQRLENIFVHPDKRVTVTTGDPIFKTGDIDYVLTEDGVKVQFEDLSFGLVRKSGTEPLVKCPSEASSKEKANLIYGIMSHVAQNDLVIDGGQVLFTVKADGKFVLQDTNIMITYDER